MTKIRKLYYFDKKNTQEIISFLNSGANDTYINRIMFNPFAPLHHFLPLRFKFLPESYVLKDKTDYKGLITVAPTRSRLKKMEIQKLFFEENCYEDAADLVQYVVSKYKAMGAVSVMVKVDDYLPSLLSMFVSKCGFSQISYEKLWRVTKFVDSEYNKRDFRMFRNSDAQVATTLYNDSLLPHFRPLLGREVREFKETVFKGLSYYSEYKYVMEDKKTRNIIAYISIITYDNENFLVEITQTNWVDLDINSVLSFVIDKIKKRKKRFGLFLKTKRYVENCEKYETQFMKNGFECVQNQIVLTNSSAKVLKNIEKSGKFTVLGDFNPVTALGVYNKG